MTAMEKLRNYDGKQYVELYNSGNYEDRNDVRSDSNKIEGPRTR